MEQRVEDEHQRLFENDGKGHFRDATAERGLRRVCMATGVNTGDIDNDGSPISTLRPARTTSRRLFPNVLLLGGRVSATRRSRPASATCRRATASRSADLDGDGDLDLAAQVGGYQQDDAFGSVLFENPGNGNHWLAVELRGKRDNRFGVGARVRARVIGGNGARDVFTTGRRRWVAGLSNPLRRASGPRRRAAYRVRRGALARERRRAARSGRRARRGDRDHAGRRHGRTAGRTRRAACRRATDAAWLAGSLPGSFVATTSAQPA
jgi:hypothetical protein